MYGHITATAAIPSQQQLSYHHVSHTAGNTTTSVIKQQRTCEYYTAEINMQQSNLTTHLEPTRIHSSSTETLLFDASEVGDALLPVLPARSGSSSRLRKLQPRPFELAKSFLPTHALVGLTLEESWVEFRLTFVHMDLRF